MAISWSLAQCVGYDGVYVWELMRVWIIGGWQRLLTLDVQISLVHAHLHIMSNYKPAYLNK